MKLLLTYAQIESTGNASEVLILIYSRKPISSPLYSVLCVCVCVCVCYVICVMGVVTFGFFRLFQQNIHLANNIKV